MPAWAIKLAAGAALLVALFGAGWFKGRAQVQAKWDAAKTTQQAADLKEAGRQATATIETIIKYVDKVRIIKGKTETVIKEVPKYVTQKADADCVVNYGFVRLHNAAAANTVPDAPRDTDAAAAGVALSAVATTVAENYGACWTNSEQLKALQGWVLEMSAANGR